MSTLEHRSEFVARFDRIWAQARRVQLSQAFCWSVLTALAGLALLAAADYWLELSRPLRVAAVGTIGLAAVGVGIYLTMLSIRRWRRAATAATIEHVFPQLGQRIRTTVQYGDLSAHQIQEAGATDSLVVALEEDTMRLAQPLPLDAVVPWKSLALASLLAAALGLLLAGASAFDWQWRAAARRAFLGELPYTQITVKPGNTTVKEGESLLVEITVRGRTGDRILFQSRRTDEEDSAWQDEALLVAGGKEAGERAVAFEMPLERIRHPLEYRVAAGSAQSDVYRVEVLYPLKIVRQEATIQSPAYTGLPEEKVESGNVTALVGSHVKLEIELDRAPSSAWLDVAPLSVKVGETVQSQRLPLAIAGVKLATEFDLTTDQTYTVVARSADGMELPENKFRLRARPDEPPQVWFESPSEALEVHTLAEILMRIRVSDDFGVSRAGIMFEVNNEEEYPLLMQDFQAAAEELKATGQLTPQTRATLEKVLPLEHFQLVQQDSVMYYAFAEDTRPGSAQRTESDLRFIDIRPFRRNYRVLPEGEGEPQEPRVKLKSLDELIARQRYALNRAIQLDKKQQHSGQADLAGADALIKFQGELAKSTRELAEGLAARRVPPEDLENLYQAEAAMLTATDSLSAGKFDTATLQMRDALKYLIEGRNKLDFFLSKNRDRAQLAQLRSFDRTQRQKLRRPKSDEEEAKAIAERLEELAQQEDFVYATISGILDPEAVPVKSPTVAEDGSGITDKLAPPSEEKGASPQPLGGKPLAAQPAGQQPPTDTPAGEKAGDGKPSDTPGGGRGQLNKEELADRQLDIAAEARELEKALSKLPKATELAKQRMAAVAKAAEENAETIGRGKLPEAKDAAGGARDQFRELSQQVKGLLADEQADRIAAAQRMAANLARMQQEFSDRLADPGEAAGAGDQQRPPEDRPRPGAGRPQGKPQDKPMPGLGGAAQKIAEKAKTLDDVLGAAGRAERPADIGSAEKVKALVSSLDLAGVAQRLSQLPDQVKNNKLENAKATVGDGAERMEAASQQLSVLHRTIVSPKVAELAELEQKLAALREQLDKLEADSQVTAWHVEANAALEQLDEQGIDPETRREFAEEMRKNGWGPGLQARGWAWGRIESGYYRVPGPYRVLLSRLSESIQSRMQELLLGDLKATGDEPIPPQYQDLVDKYYRVLATEGKPAVKGTGAK